MEGAEDGLLETTAGTGAGIETSTFATAIAMIVVGSVIATATEIEIATGAIRTGQDGLLHVAGSDHRREISATENVTAPQVRSRTGPVATQEMAARSL